MQITLSNLPEAVELFRQRTGAVVHDVAVLRRVLIKVRTAHDLEAALALVRAAAGGVPLILVAFFGDQGFDKALNINLGWPKAWIATYSANQFHRVDPVAYGPAGAVFPWSPMLTTLEPRTKLDEQFARAIKENQMQYGLSYIGEWQDCRVILSMIGKEIEDDRETRDLLEVLMPDLVDVAYRVFASNRKTSQMEVIQQTLIELYCHKGLKKDEIALELGMTRKGVDYHINQLMDRYSANTIEQLMFKIGACE
ncbi:autoinducer binding domain-containing protein [Chromobacterium haemolyticum]|nr:autoinducer binding domain-containing protein [Chromobacterium haemolyticum]